MCVHSIHLRKAERSDRYCWTSHGRISTFPLPPLQSLTFTAINDVWMQLDYVRKNASIEDVPIGSRTVSPRPKPSTEAVEATAPYIVASAPIEGGRDRSCNGRGSPDGRTDGTESSEEDAGQAAAAADGGGKCVIRGGVFDSLGLRPPPPAAEKAMEQGLPGPSESGAWEVADVALRILQGVERKAAGVVSQEKDKQVSRPISAATNGRCRRPVYRIR